MFLCRGQGWLESDFNFILNCHGNFDDGTQVQPVSGKFEMLDFYLKVGLNRKKVGGISLLFKLKLSEFHFGKLYYLVFITDKHFEEKYKKQSHSRSGFRIVAEAFFKVIEYMYSIRIPKN